jgi:hypothetical protein
MMIEAQRRDERDRLRVIIGKEYGYIYRFRQKVTLCRGVPQYDAVMRCQWEMREVEVAHSIQLLRTIACAEPPPPRQRSAK